MCGRKWEGSDEEEEEFGKCRYMKWQWLVDEHKTGNIYRRIKRKVFISIHKLMTVFTN
jgi:hypothetical protein